MGRQTTNPSSGPAMPMSKSARRSGNGLRIRMNAPSVPTRLRMGAGMKNGTVALTP